MGRAKTTMKRIKDERARKVTFMQRRKGLMTKISEFSITCGAEACLIVYDVRGSNAEPVTHWPQDTTRVNSILQKYEHQKIVEMPLKTFDLEDYFENKKDMVEAEISKVHKKILKFKYLTWDPCFNNIGEEQLRAFIAMLDAKIGACVNRISMLKTVHQSEASCYNFMQNKAQESVAVKPLNELVEWDDLDPLGEPQDCASKLVEEHHDWANQVGDDLVHWVSQPDVFALQDISFMNQYDQPGATLHAFQPPSWGGF